MGAAGTKRLQKELEAQNAALQHHPSTSNRDEVMEFSYRSGSAQQSPDRINHTSQDHESYLDNKKNSKQKLPSPEKELAFSIENTPRSEISESKNEHDLDIVDMEKTNTGMSELSRIEEVSPETYHPHSTHHSNASSKKSNLDKVDMSTLHSTLDDFEDTENFNESNIVPEEMITPSTHRKKSASNVPKLNISSEKEKLDKILDEIPDLPIKTRTSSSEAESRNSSRKSASRTSTSSANKSKRTHSGHNNRELYVEPTVPVVYARHDDPHIAIIETISPPLLHEDDKNVSIKRPLPVANIKSPPHSSNSNSRPNTSPPYSASREKVNNLLIPNWRPNDGANDFEVVNKSPISGEDSFEDSDSFNFSQLKNVNTRLGFENQGLLDLQKQRTASSLQNAKLEMEVETLMKHLAFLDQMEEEEEATQADRRVSGVPTSGPTMKKGSSVSEKVVKKTQHQQLLEAKASPRRAVNQQSVTHHTTGYTNTGKNSPRANVASDYVRADSNPLSHARQTHANPSSSQKNTTASASHHQKSQNIYHQPHKDNITNVDFNKYTGSKSSMSQQQQHGPAANNFDEILFPPSHQFSPRADPVPVSSYDSGYSSEKIRISPIRNAINPSVYNKSSQKSKVSESSRDHHDHVSVVHKNHHNLNYEFDHEGLDESDYEQQHHHHGYGKSTSSKNHVHNEVRRKVAQEADDIDSIQQRKKQIERIKRFSETKEDSRSQPKSLLGVGNLSMASQSSLDGDNFSLGRNSSIQYESKASLIDNSDNESTSVTHESHGHRMGKNVLKNLNNKKYKIPSPGSLDDDDDGSYSARNMPIRSTKDEDKPIHVLGKEKGDLNYDPFTPQFQLSKIRKNAVKKSKSISDKDKEKATPSPSSYHHQHQPSAIAERKADESEDDEGDKKARHAQHPSPELWTKTMNMKRDEVEFLLRRQLNSNEDIDYTLAAAEAGLLFMDELERLSKGLGVLRGTLSRWLLPYDSNTKITEQSSSVGSVINNMPDSLRGKISDKQIHYLVKSLNSVRSLVRIKIADDNDLEQARAALKTLVEFLKRLTQEAENMEFATTPYELLLLKRFS